MRNRFGWVPFLLVCFLVTGIAGLFASYAATVPLERALHRSATAQEALPGAPGPEALRHFLREQASIRDEAEREAAAVGARARLILGVVTVLASGLGSGILLLAAKG